MAKQPTKAEKIESMVSDPDIQEVLSSGSVKDHTNEEVQKALSTGKEMPSGTVLNFYGRSSVDIGAGSNAVETGGVGGDDE